MQTGPAKLPKSTQLIEELNELSRHENVSDIDLMRIKREAEKLKPIDKYGSYLVLGIIAVIKEDVDSMISAHENAIRFAHGDELCHAYNNYYVSLNRLGFRTRGHEALKQAHSLNNGNISITTELVESAMRIGRFHEALYWLNKLERIKEEPAKSGFFKNIKSVVDKCNLNDEYTHKLVSTSHEVLTNKGIYDFLESIEIHEDDGTPWIAFKIGINENFSYIMELNIELWESIASLDESLKVGSSLSIRYVPMEENKEQQDGDRNGRFKAVSATA